MQRDRAMSVLSKYFYTHWHAPTVHDAWLWLTQARRRTAPHGTARRRFHAACVAALRCGAIRRHTAPHPVWNCHFSQRQYMQSSDEILHVKRFFFRGDLGRHSRSSKMTWWAADNGLDCVLIREYFRHIDYCSVGNFYPRNPTNCFSTVWLLMLPAGRVGKERFALRV